MSRLALSALFVIALSTIGCGTGTPAPTPAPPTQPPTACALAWAAAAAEDAMHDSVSDLFPAVRACSLTEWRAEFERYDGLAFIGTADSVLTNMCFSAEIAETALCKSLP